jgi:hypothetical protein
MLLLSLFALILLLLFAKVLRDEFTSAGKIGVCQASILKAHISERATKGATGAVTPGVLNLDCNDLPDTTIKTKDVIKNGEINDDAVKKKIADSMLSCWKMVGRGQLDPYAKYDDDKVYCLICSDVTFEPELVTLMKERNYKVRDVFYWLATHNAPNLKTSYYEELYLTKPDTREILEMKNQDFPLDTSQQYSIIWRMDAVKKSLAGTLFITGIPTLVGARFGGAIGAAAGFYGAYLITKYVFGDKVVSTAMLVVPKAELANTFVLGTGQNTEKRPFCTKLVNY